MYLWINNSLTRRLSHKNNYTLGILYDGSRSWSYGVPRRLDGKVLVGSVYVDENSILRLIDTFSYCLLFT